MQNSIGIIGMGWVGSSVAISLLHNGICKELLLNDSKQLVAEGEAMDLNHGSSFYPSAIVKAAKISDMMHCNAIVITAGRGGKPGESRLDLLQDNIKIAKSISEKLTGYKGIIIVVSNPVDVLTYFYQKFTKLPAGRVIGTGTMLDTARLRTIIGNKLNLDPRSVHANVVGEHGDSELVLWSRAGLGGEPIANWRDWEKEYETEIADQVRTAAQDIIKRKGATNHAIGLVTATLLKWILRGDRRIISVSTVMDQKVDNQIVKIATSLPSLVTSKGVEEVLQVSMNTSEREKFDRSNAIIYKAINEANPS